MLAFQVLAGETVEGINEELKKEGVTKIEVEKIDRSKFLNYGYDFGLILYHLAKRDPLSAFSTARSMVIDGMNHVWKSKKKSSEDLRKLPFFNNNSNNNDPKS